MKNSTNSVINIKMAKAFPTKVFLAFTFVFLLSQFSVKAQTAPPPACNLSGSLSVAPGGNGEATILAEVVKTSAKPNLVFSFGDNPAGAYIKSYGPLIYNEATHRATQTLIIVTGNTTKGQGYNLKLSISSANGSCECSKSVSLVK